MCYLCSICSDTYYIVLLVVLQETFFAFLTDMLRRRRLRLSGPRPFFAEVCEPASKKTLRHTTPLTYIGQKNRKGQQRIATRFCYVADTTLLPEQKSGGCIRHFADTLTFAPNWPLYAARLSCLV